MEHCRTLIYIFVLFTNGLFVGCAAYEKAAPLSSTFLEDVDLSNKANNMPFAHSWAYLPAGSAGQHKLFIKPVRIDLLPEDAWKPSASFFLSSREDYLHDAEEIANYFHDQLVKQFKSYPKSTIEVVDNPESAEAVVEIAITELEFSHPGAQTATLATPLPWVDIAFSELVEPHAAFALRITDTDTGKLRATVADRKFPPTRLMDFNKLTVKSSIREICNFWAQELVDAFNKGRFGKVESVGIFRLLPW